MNTSDELKRNPYFILGRFLGIADLLEKKLLSAEDAAKYCVEIAKEYTEAKEKIHD
jgi:hypothetical protein